MEHITKLMITPGRGRADEKIYGQFIEHLGSCINGGVYDPKSRFADENGIRSDVRALAKRLAPPVLRFPGGTVMCLYHWEDAVGPMEGRMRRKNLIWGGEIDPSFGTAECVRYCREIGAEPMICVNMASGTPEEAGNWVEYCNGPAESKYGRLRAQRGHHEPYNVKWWSLGNDMGYGHMEGANTPDGYASLVETHARAMLKVTPDLKFVSSGPYPNQEWVDVSIKKLAPIAPYVSLHTYNSVHWDFTSPEGMERCYNEMIRMPIHNLGILRRLHDMLPEKTFISYDEWNLWKTWCRNPSSMEGIFTAQMLHMFMHESEKQRMPMACYFEPVNEGAMQVHPDHTELTATGQAFALLSRHAGGKLCTVDGVEDFEVVATIDDHHVLTLTMLNLNWQEETTYSLNKCGTILENKVLQAENLLPGTPFTENPLMIHVKDDIIKAKLPPRSVACISISLVE